MHPVTSQDMELIEAARKVIRLNYDGVRFCHTVGAAVRCPEGRIYVGVNLYALHGACAEQVALGTAAANGERTFLTIVAVRSAEGEIIPPCGNCRQILLDYAPECEVILAVDGKLRKIAAKELLP